MIKSKKLTALFLTAMMMVTAGCSSTDPAEGGEEGTAFATVDGENISTGIYLYEMQVAQAEALMLISAEGGDVTDLSAATVEGTPAYDWIEDTAMRYMQEYIAGETLFEELGLSLTEEELAQGEEQSSALWNDYGYAQAFEPLGISESDFEQITLNSLKKNSLFNHYYGVGGELEPTAEEYSEGLEEYFYYLSFINLPLSDAEGVAYDEATIAAERAIVDGYYDRLMQGESFYNIIVESETRLGNEDIIPEEGSEIAQLMNKESVSISPEFTTMLEESEYGEYFIYQDEYSIMLLQKQDPASNPENLELVKYSIALYMHSDDFADMLLTKGVEVLPESAVDEAILEEYAADKIEYIS